MSKKIASSDKINDTTLHELLQMMDAKLNHIEDITADNRAVIIKLVKQSNQIVKFLSNIEIEDVTDEFENITSPAMSKQEKLTKNKMIQLSLQKMNTLIQKIQLVIILFITILYKYHNFFKTSNFFLRFSYLTRSYFIFMFF